MSVLKRVVLYASHLRGSTANGLPQASHTQLPQASPQHTLQKDPFPPEFPSLSHKVVQHLLQFPSQL